MSDNSRHNRYNQHERLNPQELAAAREHEQIQRDLVAFGHDKEAALRASRIAQARQTMADVLPAFPTELQEVGRQKLMREIADIRASGPVGCTCAYWRCVESRPALDENEGS
jgi:hypothetical protein